MFTGLVQAVGALRARAERGPGARVEVDCGFGELELGESIAVQGACLTVTVATDRGFAADLSAETLAKTTLGLLAPGARVNLERSLRLGDRLGGHLVQGHVDGVGRVRRVDAVGEARRVVLTAPAELARFIAPKGSMAVDGVSLTVNSTEGSDFEVMLIPQTLELTTLTDWQPGREVNLEVDLLARYAVNWLEVAQAEGATGLAAKVGR